MGNTMIEDKFIHIKNQPIKVDANIKSQMGTSDDPVRVKSVGGGGVGLLPGAQYLLRCAWTVFTAS